MSLEMSNCEESNTNQSLWRVRHSANKEGVEQEADHTHRERSMASQKPEMMKDHKEGADTVDYKLLT